MGISAHVLWALLHACSTKTGKQSQIQVQLRLYGEIQVVLDSSETVIPLESLKAKEMISKDRVEEKEKKKLTVDF